MSRGVIFDDVTDTSGNALPGISVTIFEEGTTTKATLYDARVGGNNLDNPLTTNDRGIFLAYLEPGSYDISVAAPTGTFVKPGVPALDPDDVNDLNDNIADINAALDLLDDTGALNALQTVDTLAELKAFSTSAAKVTYQGLTYNFTSGDYSAEVAADGVGVFIESDDVASTSGAWVADIWSTVDVDKFGGAADATTSGLSVSGTDNSDALTRACAAAGFLGAIAVTCYGPRRFSSSVTIPEGINVTFGRSGRPVYNNTTGEWENVSGNVQFIDHGKGVSEDTWASSAFVLEEGANIIGGALCQPAQDMNTLTPSSYPPAISIDVGSLTNIIHDINLTNCYVGIDARRDHGRLSVNGVIGWPLYKGIRIGSMVDNDSVCDVHANPQYAYTGNVDKTNSVVNWVWDNGDLLELGRNSWSEYRKIFGYNYRSVVYGYYQQADAGNGINNAGGTEIGTFFDIGADSCQYGMDYNGQGNGGNNSHWGVKVYGINGAIRSAYDATKTGADVVRVVLGASSSRGDFKFFGGRAHDCDADVFDLAYTQGAEIHGFEFYDYAKSVGSGKGVRINNTVRTKVIGGHADGQGNNALQRAVFIGANNTDTTVTGLGAVDFLGAVVEIQNNGNTRYQISGNSFQAGATTDAILDSQQDDQSIIGPNLDSRSSNNVLITNSDVSGGLLTIPTDGQDIILKYNGTTDFSGITPVREHRRVTIHFDNAITITDSDAGQPAINRLQLAGNFVTTGNDTLTIMHDGTQWWEVARSPN